MSINRVDGSFIKPTNDANQKAETEEKNLQKQVDEQISAFNSNNFEESFSLPDNEKVAQDLADLQSMDEYQTWLDELNSAQQEAEAVKAREEEITNQDFDSGIIAIKPDNSIKFN